MVSLQHGSDTLITLVESLLEKVEIFALSWSTLVEVLEIVALLAWSQDEEEAVLLISLKEEHFLSPDPGSPICWKYTRHRLQIIARRPIPAKILFSPRPPWKIFIALHSHRKVIENNDKVLKVLPNTLN